MNSQIQKDGFARDLISKVMLLVIGATATFFPGSAISIETSPPSSDPPTHMSEALRSSLKKVVVLPGRSPVNQGISGSYQKPTLGLFDGAAAGSTIGDGVSKEIGPVSVGLPFPILTLPGAIFGGIKGKTERDIQEFRDRLTADLAQAASQPLTHDALASDVFWGLRNVPNLDPKIFALTTPIPNDTDAVLYVSLTNVIIDVQGKEAIITTAAYVTLRRMSDGAHVYEKEVQYQDRDTLSNWTRNENALWRDYATFARHYIAREISAEVYDRVALRHELQPQKTDTVARIKKNAWQGISRTATPTIAWELTLLGDDSYGSWAKLIDTTDISYDVEIYDKHQLIYSAKHIKEPRHTVAAELGSCKTYRWSVRPSYHVGSDTKFGEWMRLKSDSDTRQGNVGRQASEAPAYTQDFALLKIKC